MSVLLGRTLRAAWQALRAGVGRSAADVLPAQSLLHDLQNSAEQSMRELAPLYKHYITTVSSSVWAVSLESAAVLDALCRLTEPRAVVDLGSGFSSAVLRRYARSADHDCVVHSVDDDAQWLARSGEFLRSLELPDEGLVLWENRDQLLDGYDIVFHDMGSMALREESLGFVLAHRATKGMIVLDDMHKTPYGANATKFMADAGMNVVPLRELTGDAYGRYASLVLAPGSAGGIQRGVS